MRVPTISGATVQNVVAMPTTHSEFMHTQFHIIYTHTYICMGILLMKFASRHNPAHKILRPHLGILTVCACMHCTPSVYIYIYIYINTHIYIMCVYICVCVCVCVYIHIHTRRHTYMYSVCVYIYVCIYTHTYTHIYIYSVCLYSICVYVFIYIYTHT